jgi:hypothetical protein
VQWDILIGSQSLLNSTQALLSPSNAKNSHVFLTGFPVDGEGLAKKLVSEEKCKTKLFGLNLNLIALVQVRCPRKKERGAESTR